MKFSKPYSQYEGKWVKWSPGQPYKSVSPKYFLVKFVRVRDRIIFLGVIVADESANKGAKELNFPIGYEEGFSIFDPKQNDYEDAIKKIWIKGVEERDDI
jgi:hypothetical protein